MGEIVKGQNILERLVETYASFHSYSDTGTVDSADSPAVPIEFQTDFKRPLCFRFSWLSWHPKFGKTRPAKETTIWSDGKQFITSFHGEFEAAERFSLLVAGATGVSKGAVHIILNVLSPESLGLYNPWHEMIDVRRLDDQALDLPDVSSSSSSNGSVRDCYCIRGTSRAVDDTDVWVEKDTFIVRRIKETSVITEQQCEEMRAFAQRPDQVEMMVRALRKEGIAEEVIAETIAGLATIFKPRTHFSEYTYKSVRVNQVLEDSVFIPSI
ncbi:MAG: hypothetical protein C0508_05735 [Cyanobacteria bacterium PR.023]|jgi:hypothetical protein|nr:hypothetical protein [Cyanobacteria bacterium PR.023]MDQ5932843.1 hypothetical protein [Cyanobacteriota bacterium erpe_2018_sw_21hr_WHONDRS-SW48-000092_B_bin.40]